MITVELPTEQATTAERGVLDVTVATDADAAAWDCFVGHSACASGYHEWPWRQVFERAFAHQPIYLVARRQERILGVLPLIYLDGFLFGRMLTSLPFVNYGGVLAETKDAAEALLDAAIDVAGRYRCRHIELRHLGRQYPNLPFRQHKVAMHLQLQPQMWERLDRKVRNQIRKAQKSDLIVEHGGVERLADFYGVFARNMRDLGTPVYPVAYFREVLAAFPDRAGLTIVRLGNAPVAAALWYRSRSTTEVPSASSVRDYNALCPNHLLYWSLIERAVEQGCTVFDFGRSTPNEGTFKFKQQWGAEPVPLFWEYWLRSGTALPNANPTNPRLQVAIQLWKRLPLAVANRLGPRVVRSLP